MSRVVELLRSRLWPRAVALALIAVGAAACSSETTRFNDNPFASRNPDATGSIPQTQGAPGSRVESAPLPAQPGVPAAGAGIAGGGRGMASYTPSAAGPSQAHPSAAAADITGTTAKPVPSGSWTWDGGKPVTVGAGDTLDGIARRYG